MYHEWRKVENKSSDKGSKIFHFLKMLKKDFSLIEHSERIDSQYSGFKKACIKAMNSKGDAATSHVDWSENV